MKTPQTQLAEAAVQFLNAVLKDHSSDLTVTNAAFLVAGFQWDQSNQPPHSTLLNHILPVFVRVCDITKCSNTRGASLLHDFPEDASEKVGGRERAFEIITHTCNPKVAEIVRSVTNDEHDFTRAIPGEEAENLKRRLYQKHVREHSLSHPEGRVLKLADFCEYATRFVSHPKREKRIHLAKKYGPLVPDFLEVAKEVGYAKGVEDLNLAANLIAGIMLNEDK